MKRKITQTIRFRITALFMLNVIVLILMLCFCNSLFFEEYYVKSKQQQLKETFHKLSTYIGEYDDGDMSKSDFENNIEKLCSSGNMSAIILRSDWAAMYATANDTQLLKERMRDNILGFQNKDSIIEKNSDFTLLKVYDSQLDGEYFEIFGYVDSENSVLIRMPVKSIKDSVQLSNVFILKLGMIFILLSAVNAYFIARSLSRPIKQLSGVAKRMTDIKFDERYEGKDKDEIGDLGRSLNIMADRLDGTISELKTANNELKNDIENKKKIEESRIDFIANVSHELKTPIALIQGYAEGLKEEIFDSRENAEYYCDVIIDESLKMNEMVKKLLSLNQLESQDSSMVIEKINVTDMIAAIVENNKKRMEQKEIVCHNMIKEPLIAWADEFMIEEVVTNYISNAINHCDGDKIITISAEPKTDVVRINVSNTGNRIPEESLERIWEKFYKVDKARTREYGGNGIGLSIVKAIMERHNKAYGVNNLENGVNFWFELDTKVEK